MLNDLKRVNMSKILIIAQCEGDKVLPATRSAIAAGLKIADTVDVLLMCQTDTCSQALAALAGVATVWVNQQPQFSHLLAEDMSPVICHLIKQNQGNQNIKQDQGNQNTQGDVMPINDNMAEALAPNTDRIDGDHTLIFAQTPSPINDKMAEALTPNMDTLNNGYTHIFAPATTFGKNVMPRVAALCDVVCQTDVTDILAPDILVRPIYAGNAFETVQVFDRWVIATIRPTAFLPVDEQSTLASIRPLLFSCPPFKGTQFISSTIKPHVRAELTSAKRVLSGGRAFQNAQNFKLLENLADRLGAAVGATRAAVDAGFAPNEWQVGQTGKVVAPDLYMAFGISGAIQHVAGMKDSKVIVAINQDPQAPIFEVADYGLVGDLFTILPEFEKLLQ